MPAGLRRNGRRRGDDSPLAAAPGTGVRDGRREPVLGAGAETPSGDRSCFSAPSADFRAPAADGFVFPTSAAAGVGAGAGADGGKDLVFDLVAAESGLEISGAWDAAGEAGRGEGFVGAAVFLALAGRSVGAVPATARTLAAVGALGTLATASGFSGSAAATGVATVAGRAGEGAGEAAAIAAASLAAGFFGSGEFAGEGALAGVVAAGGAGGGAAGALWA